MTLTTDARFSSLKQGDHVCAVYDSAEEQTDAIMDYMKRGILSGERCVYIVDDRNGQEINDRLAAKGVDVGAAVDSGRFILATKRETYLRSGSFDPDAMVDFLRASEQEALADGCQGLRVSGEMTWALGPEIGCDRLIEYETKLNRVFPGSRSHAICQYNRQRFPAEVIRDVLRTHPIAVIGQYACPNPYYEPPELLAAGHRPRAHVDWMIGQILAARENELKLQAGIRERDEFLSIASHELRTPLNALNLCMHALESSLDSDPVSTRRSVERAKRQVDRLGRLVSILLDVSRIHESRLEWQPEPLDLLVVAQEAAVRFELDARSAGSQIRVEGASAPGLWDRARLDQILENLISNAIKFGEGKPIDVLVTPGGESVSVAIIDRGVGIHPDQQARIFDRFACASSARHYAGLGLGLWITRELTQLMGGRIEVQSQPGRGSTFSVHLPAQPRSATGV